MSRYLGLQTVKNGTVPISADGWETCGTMDRVQGWDQSPVSQVLFCYELLMFFGILVRGNKNEKVFISIIMHCSRDWSCTDHVNNHEVITWLSCTDHVDIMHWSVADHTRITWLIMHWSRGYHALITWLSCTDHETDHALITWLSCTAHVADHAMITQLPCSGHMTDHALITQLIMHSSPGLSCIDHVTDHVLIMFGVTHWSCASGGNEHRAE